MNNKVLHVVVNDKFIAPYINFMKVNELDHNHIFLYFGGVSEKDIPIPKAKNIDILSIEDSRLKKISYFLKYFYVADKIILHSLLNPLLIKFLYLQPWLLKKCYWVIWGGDLYYHVLAKKDENYLLNEKWRKKVIKKMGHMITSIKGDYELAQKWYGSKGSHHKCFMYPSNLYKEYDIKPKKHATINIQLGNSADPTNNHIEILEKLLKYKDKDIRIYVPLSYGDQDHAEEVIRKGRELFGDKFIPLTDFMPFEKYLEFLGSTDIAIFAHNRQQAMGNIRTLLGLGKKVYMTEGLTSTEYLKQMGIKVFYMSEFNLETSFIESNANRKIIKENFSEQKLKECLEKIFEG